MDFFNFKRRAYSKLVSDILGEAWTPERKSEVEKLMQGRGFEIVEHRVIGDYDIALWKYVGTGELQGVHSVSLNSGQYDPGDYFTQKSETAPQKLGWGPVELVLGEWAAKYGRLLVSSVSLRRLNAYRRLLSHSFLLADYEQGEPKAGFFILPNA